MYLTIILLTDFSSMLIVPGTVQ